jgi:hypothetical protein
VANENSYPSIANYNNYIYITWQRKTSSNSYDIYFAASSDYGVTWDNFYNYAVTNITNATQDPLPVIMGYNGFGSILLAFTQLSGIKWYFSLNTYPSFFSGWYFGGTLGNYGASNVSVSSNFSALVYKADYGPIIYNYYNGAWYGNNDLSSIVPGGGNHQKPSLATNPTNYQMHVAWKKLIGSGSSPYDHLIIHRKSTNYYTWPNEWFGTYYQMQDNPSITSLPSNNAYLLFQTPSQFGSPQVYKMQFYGTYWSSPWFVSSNAQFPSFSSGSSQTKYVYTTGINSPYTVNLHYETLGKGMGEIDPQDFYTRSISLLDSLGSFIELKIHSLGFRIFQEPN